MEGRNLLHHLHLRQLGRARSAVPPQPLLDRLGAQMLQDRPSSDPRTQDDVAFVTAVSTLDHLRRLLHDGDPSGPELVSELRHLRGELTSSALAHLWAPDARTPDTEPYRNHLLGAGLFAFLLDVARRSASPDAQRAALRLLEWTPLWAEGQEAASCQHRLSLLALRRLLPLPGMRASAMSVLRALHDRDRPPTDWAPLLDGTGLRAFTAGLLLATEWQRANPSAPSGQLRPFVARPEQLRALVVACRAAAAARVHLWPLAAALRALVDLLASQEAREVGIDSELRREGLLGLLASDVVAAATVTSQRCGKDDEAAEECLGDVEAMLLGLVRPLVAAHCGPGADLADWRCLFAPHELLAMLPGAAGDRRETEAAWAALQRLFFASEVRAAAAATVAVDAEDADEGGEAESLLPQEGAVAALLRLRQRLRGAAGAGKDGDGGDHETGSAAEALVREVVAQVRARPRDWQWAAALGLLEAEE